MDTWPGTAPLIVVIGETASGKSALALDLAECYQGEIISADALTVRRKVDIGAAKPSAVDRARIPHHLIDVAAPCEDFTAAVFKARAVAAINDIASRGKLPILAGGTGLYVDAALFDYSFLPAGDRQAREVFNQMKLPDLLGLVKEKGLDASHIDTQNKRRVIRLLETGGRTATRAPMRSNTLVLGLRVSREELEGRVSKRVDAMLTAGLEDEAQHLAQAYGWDCEALKGIGYREWQDYFSGVQTLDETRQRIIKSTLDLAKKQRTWFRRNNSIQWIGNIEQAVAIVTTFLSKFAE